jgi:hypothetical protein
MVVDTVIERMIKYHMLLVQGTPASGKTVLMNLIHQRLLDQHPHLDVRVINSWPSDVTDEERTFRKLERSTARTIDQLWSDNNCVILVDEAQGTYTNTAFWGFLKQLLSGRGAYVVLFNAYGSRRAKPVELAGITPPILGKQARIGLTWKSDFEDEESVGLLLSDEEVADVCRRWEDTNNEGLRLSDEIKDHFRTVSGGHAGVFAGLLQCLIDDEKASFSFF